MTQIANLTLGFKRAMNKERVLNKMREGHELHCLVGGKQIQRIIPPAPLFTIQSTLEKLKGRRGRVLCFILLFYFSPIGSVIKVNNVNYIN